MSSQEIGPHLNPDDDSGNDHAQGLDAITNDVDDEGLDSNAMGVTMRASLAGTRWMWVMMIVVASLAMLLVVIVV